jgi:hypothetical protein
LLEYSFDVLESQAASKNELPKIRVNNDTSLLQAFFKIKE